MPFRNGEDMSKLTQVTERDGWLCWLCQRIVKRHTRSDSDPLGPTLDHLVLASRRGGNHVANLALAHHYCNNQRGAMPVVKVDDAFRDSLREHINDLQQSRSDAWTGHFWCDWPLKQAPATDRTDWKYL